MLEKNVSTDSILLNKTLDFSHNAYLFELDLINKYNLKEKKEVPSFNKLVIELSIPKSNENILDKIQFNSEFEIKTSFIFYQIFHNLPFIKRSNWQIEKNKNSSELLQITLKNKKILTDFIYRLILEKKHFSNIEIKSVKQIKNKITKNISQKQKGYVFSVVVQISIQIDTFLNFNQITNDFKDRIIKLNFYLNYNSKKLNFDKKKLQILDHPLFNNIK